MFTRQHYNLFAAEIREKFPVESQFTEMSAPERSVNTRNLNDRTIIVNVLCSIFKRDNASFNEPKFRSAAGEVIEA